MDVESKSDIREPRVAEGAAARRLLFPGLALLALILLAAFALTLYWRGSGEASAPTAQHNVIVVGWDGVQRDRLMECINKRIPECRSGLPNLMRLSGGRIFNMTITNGDTVTKPGWAQLLSGYDDDTMGIYNNALFQPLPKGYSIFEKIEAHFNGVIVTAFIASKKWNMMDNCSTGEPWCLTKDSVDYFRTGLSQNKLLSETKKFLAGNRGKKFFVFIYFHNPDGAGHGGGSNSSQYVNAIIEDDALLGELLDILDEFNLSGDTRVYVVTDHGFDETGRTHLNAPYGFFASNDMNIVRSGDRLDFAPTLLEDYGIGVDEEGTPPLRGRSMHSIPSVDCIPEGGGYVDYPGAPECCRGLTKLNLTKYVQRNFHLKLFPPNCVQATGGEGDMSGQCTLCGEGNCRKPEDLCNCPQDCA